MQKKQIGLPEMPVIPPAPSKPIEIPALPKFDEGKVMEKLEEVNENILKVLNNSVLIYDKINETEMLTKEEQEVVPKEDRTAYIDAKQNNPKMAERLLESYKKENGTKK